MPEKNKKQLEFVESVQWVENRKMLTIKCMFEQYVFKCLWNFVRESLCQSDSGRLFHAWNAATYVLCYLGK